MLSLRRRRKTHSWSPVSAQVEVVERRALLSAAAIEHEGIGYFLSETTAQVLRYDIDAESWMTAVDVTSGVGLPSVLHVDSDGLYVAFNKSVFRYGLDGSNETHLLDAARDVLAIHSDGNLLIAHSGGGRVDGAVSLDKDTNAVLDTTDGFQFFYNSTGTSISESTNRIFGRSTGISPADITYLSYDENGNFIRNDGSPYHGDYPGATKTWTFPGGSRVIDSSGTIYSTDSLTYLASLDVAVLDDITFLGNNIPITLSNADDSQLKVYTSGLVPAGKATLQHDGQEVFVNDANAIVFRLESGQWLTEFVPLSDLDPPTPGQPVDPVGLPYTPDQVEVASDGTLLIFSRAHQSIFRWDVQQQIYLDTIPLLGSPQRIAYSAAHDTVYMAYTEGLIRELDLSVANPTEAPFVTLSHGPNGIAVAGEYLLATSGTHAIIDSDGNFIDSEDIGFHGNEYVWSEPNQKFYFIRRGVSPVDLHSFEVNENGTAYENVPPGGIGRVYDSPLHASFGFTDPTHVSPGGNFVLLGSGILHDAATLERLGTGLTNSIDDAAWLGNTLLTVRATDSGTQFQQWAGAAFELTKTTFSSQTAHSIVPVSSEQVMAITLNDGIPQFQKMDAELNIIQGSARDLILTAASQTVIESAGADALQLTIQRTGDTTEPLLVSLSAEYGLTLPSAVTIPAGESLVQFFASPVDNVLASANNNAMIVASARQYDPDSIIIQLADNEFIVTESDNTTVVNEDGTTDALMVSLPGPPSSTVYINAVLTDSKVSVTPEVLQFTSENWDQPQAMTITGIDDDILDGTEFSQFNLSVSDQSDPHFVSAAEVSVAVTILDNELPTPEITSPVGDRVDSRNVALDWDAVPDAERYEVWLTRLGEDSQPVTGSTVSTTFQFNDLEIGFYNVWVRALLPGDKWSPWGSSRFSVNLPIEVAPLSTENGDRSPILSWSEVPGATEYQVWANNTTTGAVGFINTQVTDLSFQFPDLSFGQYSVWVRPLGPRSFGGSWSSVTQHYIGPTTVSGPRATLSKRPEFSWDTTEGVDQFRIWISGPQGFRIDQSGITETTFVPEEDLLPGTYHWWMRPQTAEGRGGRWSSRGTVFVGGSVLGIEFVGESWDSSPILRWDPTEGAAKYEVYMRDLNDSGPPFIARDVDATELQLPLLLDSFYQVWVRPFDGEGNPGRWSQRFDYELLVGTSNVRIVPNQVYFSTFDRLSTEAVFRWNAHPAVITYDVVLANANGDESSVQEIHGITTNSFTPVDLPVGQWFWSVRGRTESGEVGKWSDPSLFDTRGQAQLLLPQNAYTTNPEPLLQWTPVEGAVRYTLIILDDETQTIILRDEQLTEVSYQLTTPLANGTYRLWVQALSDDNTPGPWSPAIFMTVDTGLI